MHIQRTGISIRRATRNCVVIHTQVMKVECGSLSPLVTLFIIMISSKKTSILLHITLVGSSMLMKLEYNLLNSQSIW